MKVLNQEIGKNFAIYHGDSCEVLKGIPDSSIHYSVTSIPFVFDVVRLDSLTLLPAKIS